MRTAIALVEAYAKANGMWRDADYAPIYTSTLELDMGTIVPAISGPKRPQDFVALTESAGAFGDYIRGMRKAKPAANGQKAEMVSKAATLPPTTMSRQTRGLFDRQSGGRRLHAA